MTNSGQQNTFCGNFAAEAVTFGDHAPASVSHGTGPSAAARPSDVSSALIVVVADTERDAVLRQFRAVAVRPFDRKYLTHHTIYPLGRVSRTDAILVQVAAGIVTPDSAGASTGALLDDLRPDYLIACGICYGLKDEQSGGTQRLGDVVVADQLRLIAHRKVTTGADGVEVEFRRGGEVHPSAVLLDRLRTAAVDRPGSAQVHMGPVLSESVLVNSRVYRRKLQLADPEAVAGEMEGSGIYAAAARDKVDWGLVKGISDWGYDKHDRQQQLAADNAASLLVHMMQIGGLDPVGA